MIFKTIFLSLISIPLFCCECNNDYVDFENIFQVIIDVNGHDYIVMSIEHSNECSKCVCELMDN